MGVIVLLLRLLHIVSGALWVGMAVFTGLFLAPALQEVGPDGGKVMAALQRRGIMTVMPILALVTLLSGAWLYWRDSAGFTPGWMVTPVGLAFGLGGVAALIAYGLGIGVMRPAMMRVVALTESLGPGTGEQERAARMSEIQQLRARGTAVGRLVALFLILAAAAMAVARYL